MFFPVIEDIAVVSRNPHYWGEAKNYTQLSQLQRDTTVNRLKSLIFNLMHEAQTTYQKNAKERSHYIARLSTNEFFFYTAKPLTLSEFETLQNEIAIKAACFSPGVQLILSSFAVKTENNQVANVTVYITCGSSPIFHFILKNWTSTDEVVYEVLNEFKKKETLKPLTAELDEPVMPKIRVNGIDKTFSFNNVIASKTPGGDSFITAIDICVDHISGVAKENYAKMTQEIPDILQQPISHVVVSNTIDLLESCCLGTSILHVDPCSDSACKAGIAQKHKGTYQGNLGAVKNCDLFGPLFINVYRIDEAMIYPLMPTERESLSLSADTSRETLSFDDSESENSEDFDTDNQNTTTACKLQLSAITQGFLNQLSKENISKQINVDEQISYLNQLT